MGCEIDYRIDLVIRSKKSKKKKRSGLKSQQRYEFNPECQQKLFHGSVFFAIFAAVYPAYIKIKIL